MSNTEFADDQTKLAFMCHEANRAWCEANGDFSQKTWHNAEDWQRESALKGVAVALDGASPQEQHEAWCNDKRADGWRFGPVKNAEIKEHPCLVGYDKLPIEQRAKDALFGATIRALAPALGVTMSEEPGLTAFIELATFAQAPPSRPGPEWHAELSERATFALEKTR